MKILTFLLLVFINVSCSSQRVLPAHTGYELNGIEYTFRTVILAAGQSNMGTANSTVDSLPAAYRFPRFTDLYIDERNRFEPYSPGGNVQYSNISAQFDFSLVVSENLGRDRNEGVSIVKVSVGGTKLGPNSLAGGVTWNANQRGELCDSLISNYSQAFSYYFDRGVILVPEIIMWAQGEADATNQGLADVYPTSLSGFVAYVEASLDSIAIDYGVPPPARPCWVVTLLRDNPTSGNNRVADLQVRNAINSYFAARNDIVIDLNNYNSPDAIDGTHVGEMAYRIGLDMYQAIKTIK